MRIFVSFILAFSLFIGNAAASYGQIKIKRLDGSAISSTEIESAITRLMKAARVTGIAVAIINDSKIAYVKSFGFRNKEEQKPLTEQTVMYGASFTKAVFAYLVMQLVEEGVIDLDKPVYKYLEKPLPDYDKYKDLAGDDRYKLITARMLLAHTSGFPNWRWFNKDEKLDIKFTPGTKYSYSGEGINLLQFVIEIITKKEVGQMIEERIFKPFGMTRTSMTWQERFEDNHAIGYDEKEKPLGHRKRTSARAAGSMDTTISDYAKFIQAVMQGKGLKPQTRNSHAHSTNSNLLEATVPNAFKRNHRREPQNSAFIRARLGADSHPARQSIFQGRPRRRVGKLWNLFPRQKDCRSVDG